MARYYILGAVVEREAKPWSFNGKSGLSYRLFIRPPDAPATAGAELITCTELQYSKFAVGDVIETPCPVNVFAQASDFGGEPRVQTKMAPDYDPAVTSVPAHAGL